ncbi:hypothetical protein GCM10027187_45400 [Streptosporangium sandarakinum]
MATGAGHAGPVAGADGTEYRDYMRLTAFTDISLRIVMRLAVADGEEQPTTRSVAEVLAVPYTHAAKAVARLSEMGLVDTRRGRGGGLRLTEAGRRASVGAIVRALEGDGDVAGCEDAVPCPLRAACRLRGALARAREAFYASLDPITVDDLVAEPTGPMLIDLLPPRVSAGGPSGTTPGGASGTEAGVVPGTTPGGASGTEADVVPGTPFEGSSEATPGVSSATV